MAEFDPNKPYNDLPLLPPPAEQIETTAILKQCINARVALAELKQAAELIPNAAVLVNALPLLEAQASSEIENIVTTTDKLFEFGTGLFLMLGVRHDNLSADEAPANHSPLFDANEDALIVGVRTMVGLALDYAGAAAP